MIKSILILFIMIVLAAVCIFCVMYNLMFPELSKTLVVVGCTAGALFIPALQAFNKSIGDSFNKHNIYGDRMNHSNKKSPANRAS